MGDEHLLALAIESPRGKLESHATACQAPIQRYPAISLVLTVGITFLLDLQACMWLVHTCYCRGCCHGARR